MEIPTLVWRVQVPRQGARGPQQNGNASISTGLPRPRWQSEQDMGIRFYMIDKILRLFTKRKPHVTPEWLKSLPGFVKRLEAVLYEIAPSKDAYADLKTLEQRLRLAARRMLQQPKQPSHWVGFSARM